MSGTVSDLRARGVIGGEEPGAGARATTARCLISADEIPRGRHGSRQGTRGSGRFSGSDTAGQSTEAALTARFRPA